MLTTVVNNCLFAGEYKKMAGNEFVGFSNATFLSEKSCADQNFAIGYFLKEHGVFPPSMYRFEYEVFTSRKTKTTCTQIVITSVVRYRVIDDWVIDDILPTDDVNNIDTDKRNLSVRCRHTLKIIGVDISP